MRPGFDSQQSDRMKTLLFPGAFQSVKSYVGYEGVDIWLKSATVEKNLSADCYIGHSAGSAFIIAHYDSAKNTKFIFINPLIRKMSAVGLGWAWIKYFFGEGIEWRRIVPMTNWIHGIKLTRQLLAVDFLAAIQKIPRENLLVIRGKDDRWICDEKAAAILKENHIRCVEVIAGHEWNKNIADAVASAIDKFR